MSILDLMPYVLDAYYEIANENQLDEDELVIYIKF